MGKPKSKIKVPVKTLDSIVQESNVKRSFGIKIDVEGYELEIIKGAKKNLKKLIL